MLVWLGAPNEALADPAEGTVAVVGDAADPVTMRLAAELRFAGFDVEVIEPRDPASASDLVTP